MDCTFGSNTLTEESDRLFSNFYFFFEVTEMVVPSVVYKEEKGFLLGYKTVVGHTACLGNSVGDDGLVQFTF